MLFLNDEIKKGRVRYFSGKDFDPEIVQASSKLFEGFKNSAVIACYIDSENK